MARIRGANTSPELAVRRFLHSQGLRYRLHRTDLAGKPDIVLPGLKVCIFVHGCFWHGCPKCVDGRRLVKSNTVYWRSKISGNKERDIRHQRALADAGWRVLTIWECEVKEKSNLKALARRIGRQC